MRSYMKTCAALCHEPWESAAKEWCSPLRLLYFELEAWKGKIMMKMKPKNKHKVVCNWECLLLSFLFFLLVCHIMIKTNHIKIKIRLSQVPFRSNRWSKTQRQDCYVALPSFLFICTPSPDRQQLLLSGEMRERVIKKILNSMSRL